MRLNRGCGCTLLILALADLFFVVVAIIGLVLGEGDTGYAALAVVLFGANGVAAFLIGLAAVRRLPIGGRASEVAGPAMVGSPDEGEADVSEDDSGEEE